MLQYKACITEPRGRVQLLLIMKTIGWWGDFKSSDFQAGLPLLHLLHHRRHQRKPVGCLLRQQWGHHRQCWRLGQSSRHPLETLSPVVPGLNVKELARHSGGSPSWKVKYLKHQAIRSEMWNLFRVRTDKWEAPKKMLPCQKFRWQMHPQLLHVSGGMAGALPTLWFECSAKTIPSCPSSCGQTVTVQDDLSECPAIFGSKLHHVLRRNENTFIISTPSATCSPHLASPCPS